MFRRVETLQPSVAEMQASRWRSDSLLCCLSEERGAQISASVQQVITTVKPNILASSEDIVGKQD